VKILGAPDEFIVTTRFLKVVFRLGCSNPVYAKSIAPSQGEWCVLRNPGGLSLKDLRHGIQACRRANLGESPKTEIETKDLKVVFCQFWVICPKGEYR
jgi:hypothetical protein